MKAKIIFADSFNLTDDIRERFDALGNIVRLTLDQREALLREVADADLVIAEYARIDSDFLNRGKKLKGVLVYGTGTNHVDLEAAAEKGIPVANTRGANAGAVAELTFSLMLNCLRGTADAHHYIREKKWTSGDSGKLPEKFTGTELRNKLLGIIGFGAIGRRVAEIGKGFGMEVCFHDPNYENGLSPQGTARPCSLDSLLKEADIVSVHAPLTEATRDMLNAEKLRLLKPSSVLIVTSRGGIVDEEALADMLARKKIAAAGLDVFRNEPLERTSRFMTLDNVMLTPHIGGSSHESVANISRSLFEQAKALLGNKTPINLVPCVTIRKT